MTGIMAVRSAFPVHRYPQAEFTLKVAELSGLGPGQRAQLEQLHRNAGVDYRHIVLPLPEYGGLRETGVANDDHRRGPAAGIGRPHDRAGPRGQH
jgi:alkylresorcinol/alkylpyrone synthase